MPRFVVVRLDSRLWQRLAGDGLRSVESTDRRIRRLETRASRRRSVESRHVCSDIRPDTAAIRRLETRASQRTPTFEPFPPACRRRCASERVCVRACSCLRACVRAFPACVCVCLCSRASGAGPVHLRLLQDDGRGSHRLQAASPLPRRTRARTRRARTQVDSIVPSSQFFRPPPSLVQARVPALERGLKPASNSRSLRNPDTGGRCRGGLNPSTRFPPLVAADILAIAHAHAPVRSHPSRQCAAVSALIPPQHTHAPPVGGLRLCAYASHGVCKSRRVQVTASRAWSRAPLQSPKGQFRGRPGREELGGVLTWAEGAGGACCAGSTRAGATRSRTAAHATSFRHALARSLAFGIRHAGTRAHGAHGQPHLVQGEHAGWCGGGGGRSCLCKSRFFRHVTEDVTCPSCEWAGRAADHETVCVTSPRHAAGRHPPPPCPLLARQVRPSLLLYHKPRDFYLPTPPLYTGPDGC